MRKLDSLSYQLTLTNRHNYNYENNYVKYVLVKNLKVNSTLVT